VTSRLLALLVLAIPLALTAPSGQAAPAPPAEDLPEPPIPPDNPPDEAPAPVPNVDAFGPRAPEQEGPVLKPVLDSRPRPLPGADPVPGTLYRSDQEQRRQFIPNPGIRLVVPIQK
jgi:hypothetical protein